MKVVQITARFFPCLGGVESYVYCLSRKLVENGHEVTVYTSDLSAIHRSRLPASSKLGKISVVRFRSVQVLPGLSATLIFPSLVNALLRERETDVIHVHNYGYFPAYSAGFCRLINGIPLVLTTHTTSKVSVGMFARRFYNETLGKIAVKMANHIICSTENERNYVIAVGADPRKTSVIPNGVDLEKFAGNSGSFSFKKKFGVSGKIVLCVARLSKEKGLDYLLKAVPKVKENLPRTRVTFALVGPDFGERARLCSLARGLGIDESVLFAGPLYNGELASAYLESDVYVLPSLFESFGNTLLEALAAGRPIVASRYSAAPDLMKNGAAGFLFDPHRPEEIAKALTTLLNDDELSCRMGKINRAIAAKYSWEQTAKKIERVYDEVRRSP
jgi:glycosyltransferase involved in cell wall biosynthesis